MSTSLAQDVPLPASQQSPAPQDEIEQTTVTEREDHAVEGPEGAAQHTDEDTPNDEGLGAGDEKKEADEDSTPTAIPTLIRPPSPSSRTSTPPLASGSAPKKFSSISINKKFLNKTSSPASGSPVGGTKLGLSSTSPIPTTASSTRLLSTKLTTVPSKPSSSPNPPGSNVAAPATSPWAKPALTPDAAGITLQQPAPTRARVLTTTPMGMGQGIAPAGTKVAWRSVPADGKRAPMGLSRDFPTAKEVADGKRDAQMVAQAKAAHNQAILQGLNAFTHLDPNAHRWEDEDDDDGVIDFGDGSVYPHHEHPLHREPSNDAPVAKSERFVEDFDRSWPRQRPAPELSLPKRPDIADRVLFNATSNRLEPPSAKPAPPTRLMSRESNTLDRPLPPHMQPLSKPLPPHMLEDSAKPQDRPERTPAVSATGRQPWAIREPERAPPADVTRPPATLQTRPPAPEPQPPAPITPNVDTQTAEMHTAAEKARLRRLAEEQERDAAAERARQKAKELEERFGKKETKVDPPKGPSPGFTLAQRVPVEQVNPQVLPPKPTEAKEGSWRRSKDPQVDTPEPVQAVELAPEPEVEEPPAPQKRGDHNFDNMLARIQAAIGAARALPSIDDMDESDEQFEPVEPVPIKTPVSVEYFNVSQLDIPKSPPPAWRTYSVKLPRTTAKRPPIPIARAKAFDSHQSNAPKHWIMAFEPPLQHLSQITFSRADLLLPQPVHRRFAKFADSGPIVSISPRRLVPFQKKIKKKTYDEAKPDVERPTVSIESLLEDAKPASIVTDRWVDPEPESRKKSPVKTSLAAKAEKEGLFAQGVGINIPERARALSDAKPGVRFMVSSELEGDSLLDEVNKISLETVGEGFDEAKDKERDTQAETPNTPPTLATARIGTSPNNTKTPWSNPPVRSHDHVRSMWAPTTASETPRSEGGYVGPLAASEAPTPMYPSLNAPSSADPPAPQALPAAKMPYPTQGVSPTGASFGSRASPNAYGFASPDGHPQHLGQSAYQRASNGANGYMQQAVWSPSAFGTGYGYTKTPADPKSAYTAKEAYPNEYRFSQGQQSYAGFAQSPQQQTFPSHQHHHTHAYNRAHGNNYGYYGAPGQTASRGRGNGADYYGSMEGGYYGGVAQTGAQGYGYAGGVSHAALAGAAGHAQHQTGATRGGVATGRGKMWL